MLDEPVIRQIVASAAVMFLFAGSLLGLAVGAGLLARSEAMLRFMRHMNRWVSTRRALKPLEVPRSLEGGVSKGGRWLGAVLIALGAYSAVVLAASFRAAQVAEVLKVGADPVLAEIAVDALRWFLVLGGVAAFAAGVLLLFFPHAWRSIEARASRWYSTRQLVSTGDEMRPTLDRIVEAFPRAAGAVILAMSLVATVASGTLLFQIR